MAAARPAVAAVVQLREVAVVAPGAPREAVEAADVPRLEAAVVAPGAPGEAVEAADVPRPEAAVVAPGAPQEAEVGPRGALPREAAAETADVPRLQAAVEALGARVEVVQAEALGVLPQPEVKVRVPGATLVVDPAAVSVG